MVVEVVPLVSCAPRSLTLPAHLSTFVLTEVETLGVARSLGWKVHMRCAHGYRESTRSIRKCVSRKQLDLEALVATRGPNLLEIARPARQIARRRDKSRRGPPRLGRLPPLNAV
jgi:hypothetical protein